MNITIPEDKQAEMYVLGACLNSINAINYCIPFLEEDDFYTSHHKDIFRAIRNLYFKDTQVSIESTAHELNRIGQKIDFSILMSLSMNALSADYEYYLKVIKDKNSLRKVIYTSKQSIFESSKSEADPVKVIAETQNGLMAAQGISSLKTKSYTGVLQDYKEEKNFYEYYLSVQEKRLKGLSPYDGVCSGYPLLDHALGNFQKAALYYIGARTSMGKTTFMCNLVRNMMAKYKIGIFSLEMPATNIIGKIACIVADVKYSDFEDGFLAKEKADRLQEVVKGSTSFDILIEDPSIISCQQLASRAKRMRQNGIQILFIDFLTRILPSSKHSNKHLMVDEVSKTLQTLSKELDIPIVCFCQLNRASTTKTEPGLVDFRESGSIEEDADGCLFVHRPSYYDPTRKPGLTEIIIAKNRIRGILKKIDFACDYKVSEAYYEVKEMKQQHEQIAEEYYEKYVNYKDA